MATTQELRQGEFSARQKELRSRRTALENKQKLRESTAVEFGALHLQSLRRTQRLLKQRQENARKRNESVVKEVHEKQACLVKIRCTEALQRLKEAKNVFSLKVERVYPAWCEERQERKVEELKKLQREREEMYQRRLLAKHAFEKETELNSLLYQTRQDLQASAALERNEAYERRRRDDQQGKLNLRCIQNSPIDTQQHCDIEAESDAVIHDSPEQPATMQQDTVSKKYLLKLAGPASSEREKATPSRSPSPQHSSPKKTPSPQRRSPIDKKFSSQSSFGLPVHDLQTEAGGDVAAAVSKGGSPERSRSSIIHLSSGSTTMIDVASSSLAADENTTDTRLDELCPTIKLSPSKAAADVLLNEETEDESATKHLSMSDRSRVLSTLLGKIEQAVQTKGETCQYSSDTTTTTELPIGTKKDLVKMALTGRTAQLSFFGSDACADLVSDLITDISLDLFPIKAFEGKMSNEKLQKMHRSQRGGPGDIWLSLSKHLQKLVEDKIMTPQEVVNHFAPRLLNPEISDDRSSRKMKRFLRTLVGGDDAQDEDIVSAVAVESPTSPVRQQRSPLRVASPGAAAAAAQENIQVLQELGSRRSSFSKRLLSGASLHELSEFEEEDEINLESLIGKQQPKVAEKTAVAAATDFEAEESGLVEDETMEDDEFDF